MYLPCYTISITKLCILTIQYFQEDHGLGWDIGGNGTSYCFLTDPIFGFRCTTKILAKLVNNFLRMATFNFLFLHCAKHCVHQSTHTLTHRGNLGSPIKRTGLFLDCWKKPDQESVRTDLRQRMNQTLNLLVVLLD